MGPTLQVPRQHSRTSLGRVPSIGDSVSIATPPSATNTSTPTITTSLSQSADLEAAKSPMPATSDSGSHQLDPNGRRSATPTKRNRFLKRQDCLEKGGDGELDLSITPTSTSSSLIKSSPCSPLMSLGSLGGIGLSPYPSLGTPPPAHDNPPTTLDGVGTHTLTKQRSNDAGLLTLADTAPPISIAPPTPDIYPPVLEPPPPVAHKIPAVPSVRVIPDAMDPLSLEISGTLDPAPPIMGGVTPPSNNNLNYGLLHANFRSRPDLPHPQQVNPYNVDVQQHLSPPPAQPRLPVPPSMRSQTPQQMMLGAGPPPSGPLAHDYSPASTAGAGHSSSSSLYSSATPTEQFGHCPKERDGPALGCNYCWNTTDVNGRILRRKTKYHCPECQANLCIVPCFQAYHEALEKEKPDQKC